MIPRHRLTAFLAGAVLSLTAALTARATTIDAVVTVAADSRVSASFSMTYDPIQHGYVYRSTETTKTYFDEDYILGLLGRPFNAVNNLQYENETTRYAFMNFEQTSFIYRYKFYECVYTYYATEDFCGGTDVVIQPSTNTYLLTNVTDRYDVYDISNGVRLTFSGPSNLGGQPTGVPIITPLPMAGWLLASAMGALALMRYRRQHAAVTDR